MTTGCIGWSVSRPDGECSAGGWTVLLQRALQELLQTLAGIDELTGLLTRTGFRQALNAIQAKARRNRARASLRKPTDVFKATSECAVNDCLKVSNKSSLACGSY